MRFTPMVKSVQITEKAFQRLWLLGQIVGYFQGVSVQNAGKHSGSPPGQLWEGDLV
jgi:hypothetical protein